MMPAPLGALRQGGTRPTRQKSVFQARGATALLAGSSALAGLNLDYRDPLPVTSPARGALPGTVLPARQILQYRLLGRLAFPGCPG